MLFAEGDFARARLTAEHGFRVDTYMKFTDELSIRLFTSAVETHDLPAARSYCSDIGRRAPRSWASAYCELVLLSATDHLSASDLAHAMKVVEHAAREAKAVPQLAAQLDLLTAIIAARVRNTRMAIELQSRATRVARDDEIEPLRARLLIELGNPDSASAVLGRYVDKAPNHRSGVARSRYFAQLRPTSDVRQSQ